MVQVLWSSKPVPKACMPEGEYSSTGVTCVLNLWYLHTACLYLLLYSWSSAQATDECWYRMQGRKSPWSQLNLQSTDMDSVPSGGFIVWTPRIFDKSAIAIMRTIRSTAVKAYRVRELSWYYLHLAFTELVLVHRPPSTLATQLGTVVMDFMGWCTRVCPLWQLAAGTHKAIFGVQQQSYLLQELGSLFRPLINATHSKRAHTKQWVNLHRIRICTSMKMIMNITQNQISTGMYDLYWL